MKLIVIGLLVSMSALADADDLDEPPRPPPASEGSRITDRGYVGVGRQVMWSAADSLTSMTSLDGARRLWNTPLLARAFVGIGSGGDGGADTNTRLYHARIGIEADICTAERGACMFLGIDAGWRFATTTGRDVDMAMDTSGSTSVVQWDADAGGDFLRFRMTVEIASDLGGGLQLALAHRFY